MTKKEQLLIDALEKEKETLLIHEDHDMAIEFLKQTRFSFPNHENNYFPILYWTINDFDGICKIYGIN